MKIKQTTKIIILVVALVSVIGIGAVSFAAWQNGTPSFTASAQVGSVDLLGFLLPAGWTTPSATLVPYDQETGIKERQVTSLSIDLPPVETTGTYKVVISYTGTMPTDSSMQFKALISSEAQTVNKDTVLTSWTTVTTTAQQIGETVTISEYTPNSDLGYLTIVLVSNANSDMNAGPFTFTVALEPVAA